MNRKKLIITSLTIAVLLLSAMPLWATAEPNIGQQSAQQEDWTPWIEGWYDPYDIGEPDGWDPVFGYWGDDPYDVGEPDDWYWDYPHWDDWSDEWDNWEDWDDWDFGEPDDWYWDESWNDPFWEDPEWMSGSFEHIGADFIGVAYNPAADRPASAAPIAATTADFGTVPQTGIPNITATLIVLVISSVTTVALLGGVIYYGYRLRRKNGG